MTAISISNLSKSYGRYLALNNVSINVPTASVFALLGPNGAGKTTLVKAVLDLVNIASGSITISGEDYSDYRSRNHIAYLPEKFTFFSYFTVEDTIKFFGKMYGVSSAELNGKIGDILEKLSISKIRSQKIKTLSKGQLQRTGMASLLMSSADIYILDEPFSGLDPIGIKDIKQLISELAKSGKTIFINSHILSEVEKICDEMAILHEGQVLAQGNIEHLKSKDSLEDFFYSVIKGGQVEQ